MKKLLLLAVSLSSGLLACGSEAGMEGGVEAAPPQNASEVRTVSANACTQYYVPRHTTYWDSFPMRDDGLMGQCELDEACNPTCWGVETQYAHSWGWFYCTHCP